jgi:hypothetical protein
MKPITIDRALLDKRLLGAALGEPDSWAKWLVVLRAAFGMNLNRADRRVFETVAGRRTPPKRRVRELWAVIGRRAGKSRIAAALAVYLAIFVKHKLAAGERGMVLVLALSQEQARATFDYALAFLRESPVLAREVVDTTRSEIRLRNGIVIAIHTNSFRTIRSRTLVAAICDELAFWRDESTATPDTKVYTALVPALLNARGMLIAISSPYRKTGLLYQKYKDHFGVDHAGADSDDSYDVLVVQGSTESFNPSLSTEAIANAREADPHAAPSEWDAVFRSEGAGFLDDASIERAINYDRPLELAPQQGIRYTAVTDPYGGGADQYTLCIGHKVGDQFIADVVRGMRGDPRAITETYAALCKAYGIYKVYGDNYAKDWCQNTWKDCGLQFEKLPKPASQLYLESQPHWTREKVEIANQPPLTGELRLLEIIPGRIGKDQVTHPRNCHDDLANALCACIAMVMNVPAAMIITPEIVNTVALATSRRSVDAIGYSCRDLSGGYGARTGPWGAMGERAWGQMMKRRGY